MFISRHWIETQCWYEHGHGHSVHNVRKKNIDSHNGIKMMDRNVTLTLQLISILFSQVWTVTDKWAPLRYINTINKSAIVHPISPLRCHSNLEKQSLFFVSHWPVSPLACVIWNWMSQSQLTVMRRSLITYHGYAHRCALQESSWMSFFLFFFGAFTHFIIQTQWRHMANELQAKEDSSCKSVSHELFFKYIQPKEDKLHHLPRKICPSCIVVKEECLPETRNAIWNVNN